MKLIPPKGIYFIIDDLKQKIFHARDMWQPYITNYALDLGILPGHRDYTNFIILCSGRTGSNFLLGLLNSHSRVVAFGEIFQNPPIIGWSLQGYSQSKRAVEQFNNLPVDFLEERVFKKFPLHIRAVGFKIFYYHAQKDPYKQVWDYLINKNDLRIIHNKRRNILRTYLSTQLAFLHNVWVNTSGENVYYPPITLNYEKCLEAFIQIREWELKYDQLFHKHEIYNAYYEELSKDYLREMDKIQDFLRLNIEITRPQTFKQSRAPLTRAIENYHELKERFLGSPWEAFFEE